MSDVAVHTHETALTHSQEQIWLFEQLVPGSAVHHVCLRVAVRGPFDLQAMRRAALAVVGRHEVLRTTVEADRGLPVAGARDQAPRFSIYDVEDAPAPERAARAREILANELRAPFDLAQGPLVRFALVMHDLDACDLLVMAHRLVADEASMEIFAKELRACYAALSRRRQPDLPAPRQRFAEVAARQRQLRGQADLDYWRKNLADLPDPLDLPFARPRGSEPALDAGTVELAVDADLATSLRRLAEAESTSPYAAMLAAFAILLHRYTQSQDIVLGALTSALDDPFDDPLDVPDTRATVGPLTEPTVLRLRLPYDPTPRGVLRLVHDAMAEAAAHPATFQQILAAVRPSRSLALHPVFQLLVAPRPALVLPPDPDTEEVTFALLREPALQTPYDLDLRVDADGGHLTFATGLFTAQDARTIVDHLVVTLGQLARDPDTHLSNLCLLDQPELDTLVRAWNSTERESPLDSTLPAVFARQAARVPDALALRWDDLELTYRELDERSNRLAHYLRGLGVGVETAVGLYFDYSADWVVGALATLKAGGYYVPLDPAYPTDRLVAMCTDAAVKVLLLHSHLDATLAYPRAARVPLDTAATAVAAMPTTAPPVVLGPDNLAYVMFTSGSTGRAKAIGVTHRNVIRTVCGTTYVDFQPTDVMGQASNISFDAATLEAWGALLNGIPLVGLRKADVLDAQRLRTVLVEKGITLFFLPAALAKQIVSQLPDTFASLRYLLSGGEQADLHTIQRMLRHGPPANLINPYGPTETTVFAIVYRCNDMSDDETYVPIGFPIDNTTAYVLDTYLRPVPVGVVGELYVGGAGVARGYMGQSDLTAEKFVPDPFSDQPGARLYRTGDLGRYRPNSMIDFLGRVDRQVKIRGFRVEPAEIENSLLRSGLIREVSVQVGVDRSGDQVLTAYVIPAADPLEVEQLREYARVRLPVYMVPGSFVVLPSFPLNANGKLDTRALARLSGQGIDDPAEAEPSPTQQRLAEIWQEVLGYPVAHLSQDLFSLGGDSLGAAQVLARAATVFGCELPYRLAFEHPTVAAQARAIDQVRPSLPADTDVVTGAATAAQTVVRAGAPAMDSARQRLLEIWRDVLEVPELGPDDDFFDNGGHSLKVNRVAAQVRAAFGRQVPIRLLFENRTVNLFATALAALPAVEPTSTPVLTHDTPAEGLPDISIDDLLDQVERLSEDEVGRLLDPDR